jgi:hydrogenase expression/formation protein HypE
MLGEAPRNRYLKSGGARVGDRLILTMRVAVERTALIAREKRGDLQSILSAEELNRCAAFLHTPGISVVREARLAMEIGGVHALHDPTEGGLATGLWEMAQASGVGLAIDQASIPVLPECERLCRHFGLDPLGLIASGSLLISAAPGQADSIVSRLNEQGVPASVIGEVVPPERGYVFRSADGRERPLPQFARDEITLLFEPS